MLMQLGRPIRPTINAAFADGDPNYGSKAAETQNVGIVRKHYLAIADQDFQVLYDDMHDDVEFCIPGADELPFECHACGRDRVYENLGAAFGMFEDRNLEIKSVVAQGDKVMVTTEEKGNRRGGEPYESSWCQEYAFLDGKVIKFCHYGDFGSIQKAFSRR